MPDKSKLIWVDAEYALSGDSLAIQNQKVRLIGIHAPKREQKQKFSTPGEPLAKESQTFLNKLIANHNLKIAIYYDQTQRDHFNRQLVHAFFEDGSNLQQEMLKAGLAIYRPELSNEQFAKCYIQAEQQARQGGYQLWDLLKKDPELHFPLIQSAQIYAEDEGYRIVRGEVQTVKKSSDFYIINLDTTGIRIPERAWHRFDYADIQALKGKTIEVRGLIYHYKKAMYTVIETPLAIDLLAKKELKRLKQ